MTEKPAHKSNGFLAMLDRIRQERAAKAAAIGCVIQGAILRQKKAERWAFLLPDMGEAGKWRIQYFDMNGFSGHGIRDSVDELIDTAIIGDYLVRDDGALDRVQDLPSFRRGCLACDLIWKMNAGLINRDVADAELADFDKQTVSA